VRTYLLRRGVETVASILIVAFLLFALVDLMPGDPIDTMLQADPRLTSADVARLKALHGLDRPLLERFRAWLAGALRGEFGFSRLYGLPVAEILLPRLFATLLLVGTRSARASCSPWPSARRSGRSRHSARTVFSTASSTCSPSSPSPCRRFGSLFSRSCCSRSSSTGSRPVANRRPVPGSANGRGAWRCRSAC
jgi:ABC-type dipeptide/oligopeptide/nickel transport system permease component